MEFLLEGLVECHRFLSEGGEVDDVFFEVFEEGAEVEVEGVYDLMFQVNEIDEGPGLYFPPSKASFCFTFS